MFKRVWFWLRNNWFYLMMLMTLPACSSFSPGAMQTLNSIAANAVAKLECESQGKDWKEGKCIERPVPVIVPFPEPTPLLSPSQPPVLSAPKTTILQPGESLDVGAINNTVTFYVKGLVQFNESVDRDHIWFGWKFKTPSGAEANIHFDSVNKNTHLTCQRFDGGKRERHDANPVEWNPSTTYRITVTVNADYSVHAEAWDGDKMFAAWDNTIWENPGETEWVKMGNPFGYLMPDVLEVTLP